MSPMGNSFGDEEKLGVKLPHIKYEDPFVEVVKTLSIYFVDYIQIPSTFEQLRTTSAGHKIRLLVEYLVKDVTNPALINALLTLKWHFSTLEADDRGLNETRANSCEIVAWRFLSRISERDAVDYCLYELPEPPSVHSNNHDEEEQTESTATERSSLLPQFRTRDHVSPARPSSSKRVDLLRSVSHIGGVFATDDEGPEDDLLRRFQNLRNMQKLVQQELPAHTDDEIREDPTSSFTGLNGLEIAAVADCKKFLSQSIVQKIIHGIWNGDITFFEALTPNTKKKPQFYNNRHSDIFTRLRVPRYIKAFEVLFFTTFLILFYAVLVERNPYHFTLVECLLYIWFAAFAYDELSEFIDAGSIFYAVDIWNGCDLIIILIGAAFLTTRIIGRVHDSDRIVETAFDILSLEALFIVPRIFSLLSLHPYFGTLIPCLKAMTKDFVKFMVVVLVLYLGFLTTFSLLARDMYTLTEMSWILIKVFFGSSYIGFDVMYDINQYLGPPLMIIFVVMTNILLVTSLISILSDSFSKVIAHAREEYLFVYSIYVLEASTSNRLTHFYPPLNLIPLFLIRPLRLFVSADKLRNARILLLKITHLPIVGAIWLFESAKSQVSKAPPSFSSMGPATHETEDHPGRTGSGTVTKKQKPFLSKSSTNRSSHHFDAVPVADGSHSPGPQTPRGKESNGHKAVDTADLERKVDMLSTKIAELTALLMAQQGIPTEEL